jgi:hypothetical protein
MRKLPLAGSLLLLLACGASNPTPKTSPPLTEEQAQSFENGVDFVASLEGIEGRWRDDWDKELQVRVGSSDLIALVTVRTLRTDTDPEQRVTHRLHARVDRELVGSANEEIELAVHAEAPGFNSVHQNLARLSDKQFVAYVRRGPDALHWHLSPASEQVVTETESKITELSRGANKADGQRVVVHNN